jgi:MFS family permease
MSSRSAYRIAAVAALSGLFFGFDTPVINGALTFLRQGKASGGMAVSLFLLGFLFRLQPPPAAIVLAAILAYVGSFSVGLGPGVWVVISELFPTRIRGRAMSIATVSLWLAGILVAATFLSLVEAAGSTGAFWLYAATSVVNFLFIWRVMPETKGRSLEEIERSW